MRANLGIWQVLQAVRHVLLIHKTYPPTRLDACNHVLIDRGTGKNLPASFLGDFGIDPASTDRENPIEGSVDGNPMETLFRSIQPEFLLHTSDRC